MIEWSLMKGINYTSIFSGIRTEVKNEINDLRNYVRRLLFPLYLFPIKIVTYSIYYIVRFLIKLAYRTLKLLVLAIIWPFRSFNNFLKTFFWGGIFLYFAFTEMRFNSLVERYGGYSKFFCAERLTTNKLKRSVVRVVGGLSEGSGFFVGPDEILTNFHVIADEPSPKIIFPDGSFVTPEMIRGNKDADLALLYIKDKHPDLRFFFFSPENLKSGEPLISAGYPLGTDLSGEVTVTKGIFNSIRRSKKQSTDFLQTNISIIEGMSGGPLTDQCGKVVGVNTLGLAGISFFISSDSIQTLWPTFTEQDIANINVDASVSPEDAVRAYYTYLKARRMEEGFKLFIK